MGRPKCFERDEALDRAMHCFWSRGFDATSLDDLVRETGVGRQSLYNEFGDKRAIYLAALERYAERENAHLVTIVETAPDARTALSALLATVIAESVKAPDKGCMIANAAVEMAARDEAVKKCVMSATGTLVRAIERRLDDTDDPATLARFFVTQMMGLRIAAKTVRDRKILEGIARVALGVLD